MQIKGSGMRTYTFFIKLPLNVGGGDRGGQGGKVKDVEVFAYYT